MTALLKIGLVSVSDRASQGVYPDQGIPELKNWLEQALVDPFEVVERLIPDEQPEIERTLCNLVDEEYCHLVLTTGGTGVGPRDVTVEATLDLLACELPGIMEAVRRRGAEKNPHALLSRGLAGVVECAGTRAIIINAPGSEGGASDTIEIAGPLLQHLVEQLDGADH